MWSIWMDSSTFNHCILILPIAYYLLLTAPPIRWRGIQSELIPSLLLIAVLLIWLVGYHGNVNVFQHLAIVSFIPACVYWLLGSDGIKGYRFPLLYLLFSVPFGAFLIPYLQDLTAVTVVEMIRWINIPVFLEGRYISLPSGDFVVAEACSGINYLIASVAIGVLYSYLTYHQTRKHVYFMMLAVIVPVLANILRALAIILIAHYSDMALATGVDHFIYGWVFFGVVIFLLFWIGSKFADKQSSRDLAAIEEIKTKNISKFQIGFSAASVTPFVLLIVITRLPLADTDHATWGILPDTINEQSYRKSQLSENALGAVVKNHSYSEHVRYHFDQGTVDVSIYHYDLSDRNVDIAQRTSLLYDDKWRRLSENVIEQDERSIHEFVVRKREQQKKIISWYQVGQKRTASPYVAKIYSLLMRLTRQYQPVYQVVLTCDDQAEQIVSIDEVDQRIKASMFLQSDGTHE